MHRRARAVPGEWPTNGPQRGGRQAPSRRVLASTPHRRAASQVVPQLRPLRLHEPRVHGERYPRIGVAQDRRNLRNLDTRGEEEPGAGVAEVVRGHSLRPRRVQLRPVSGDPHGVGDRVPRARLPIFGAEQERLAHSRTAGSVRPQFGGEVGGHRHRLPARRGLRSGDAQHAGGEIDVGPAEPARSSSKQLQRRFRVRFCSRLACARGASRLHAAFDVVLHRLEVVPCEIALVVDSPEYSDSLSGFLSRRFLPLSVAALAHALRLPRLAHSNRAGAGVCSGCRPARAAPDRRRVQ